MIIKSIKKLYVNLINSLRGLKISLTEHSFILELVAGAMILPLVFLTKGNFTLKIALFCAFMMLLTTELLNTAIERICNKITREYDEDIRDIKDIASAAVFIVWMVNAFLLGFYIYTIILL